MSQIFDLDTTRQQQIIVEYLTPTGSAFAVNPQGEQVFLNSRLVVAMKVQAGDIYNAFLLPNYPDKKDQIPWRAMRVDPQLNHQLHFFELEQYLYLLLAKVLAATLSCVCQLSFS